MKILKSDANKSPETFWPITGMTPAHPPSYSYICNLVVAACFVLYCTLPDRLHWQKLRR